MISLRLLVWLREDTKMQWFWVISAWMVQQRRLKNWRWEKQEVASFDGQLQIPDRKDTDVKNLNFALYFR